VRPQTLIIALLLTVTIFVPPVYIAHASVALNQTVPVLQEAVLKRMCAVYVQETARLVWIALVFQMEMQRKMSAGYAMEMAALALFVMRIIQ